MTGVDKDLLNVAHQLADAAAKAILPYFRTTDLVTTNKDASAFDPVTQADKAAELAMRELLSALRPDDGILGEEFGHHGGTTGLTWVLDPIDGTRGFVAGTPTWGVLIAVSDNSGPVLGIIDQPYIGERFVGAGSEAYFDRAGQRHPINTRQTTALDEAIVFTTFPEVGEPFERAGFEAVANQAKLVRYGMDCYAYALLAAGQIDLVIEAGLQAYDIQAPIAVIQAAGGHVTDWQGNPVHMGGRAVAAANATLHGKALEILSSFS